MPKIFLIKNRLHQQQLRLESQNAGNKNELGLADPQPLSLIVQKKDGKKNNYLIIQNICLILKLFSIFLLMYLCPNRINK